MMTQSHPTPEALSDFVQGRLEEVELEQVSAHLDACSACQRTLDQLSRANDTLIGKVREAGAAIESQPGEVSAKGPVTPTRPKPPVASREPAATAGLVIKPITWEQVQQVLTELELVSTDDLAALRQQLLAASSNELGADALRELTDQGKLTKYQAQAIFQGKAHLLSYGEYIVLDRLGAGGMGQVFKAVHRRMRRIVALKVLSSSALKNPEAVRRFEREATAAAKLSHPAIVSAYDLNTHGKTSFLVMEYIEGRDLSKIVDSKGPLPVNTAIDYILQVAEALAFAHSHGIVHRDIKPANLLIDRDGRLKVLDLGLAKFEGVGGESARTQLTVTAQVMGTVDYMAPEQALNTKKAEARSDIYSLGCTLYRLLTNQSVYDGETITERFLNHREAPIPPLRALRPDVPESLDELFRYMVGKKPEDRPATMAEVVRLLKQIAASPLTSISAMLPPGAVPMVTPVAMIPRAESIGVVNDPIRPQFEVTISSEPHTGLPTFADPTKRSRSQAANPPRRRRRLLTAIGTGALFVLLGLWLIVRDRDGNELAKIAVPNGGTATIITLPTQGCITVPPTPKLPTDGQPTNPTTLPPIAKAPFDAKQARAHQEAWAKYLSTTVETTNTVGAKMVLIPPGEFLMGSSDADFNLGLKILEESLEPNIPYLRDRFMAERPRHLVHITKPFLLGTHEITIGQFAKFVEHAKYKTQAEEYGGNSDTLKPQDVKSESLKTNWRKPGHVVTDDSPVSQVSWTDAVAFCNWLSVQENQERCYLREGDAWTLQAKANGYRLPTEAEWEYGCRAGTTTQYSFGDDWKKLENFGWSSHNSRGRTQAVGLLAANSFGLYDMHGNVWEWCHDWHDAKWYEKSGLDNPAGPDRTSIKALRGGSWDFLPAWGRSSCRGHDPQSYRSGSRGFRIVRVLEVPAQGTDTKTQTTKEPVVAPSQLTKPVGPTPPPAIAPFDAKRARAHQEAWAKYLDVPVEITNSIGVRLVLIPPGEGIYRDFREHDKKTHHRISTAYYIGVFEVTQNEFQAIAGSNPSHFVASGPNAPVENITWEAATDFCGKLSQVTAERAAGRTYSLPTQAEWCYAAQAGSDGPYCFGADDQILQQYAWYKVNAHGKTHPVGQKIGNAWGLFDVHGNVEEWSSRRWGANNEYASVTIGSWDHEASHCVTGMPFMVLTRQKASNRGFRVVCKIEAQRHAATFNNVSTSESSVPTNSPMPTIEIPSPKMSAIAPLSYDTNGYAKLFNGVSLKGWTQLGTKGWRVESGELVGAASEDAGWLVTDHAFDLYDLELEYRLQTAGHSGVCLSMSSSPNPKFDLDSRNNYKVPLIDESKPEFASLPDWARTGSLYRHSPRLKTPIAPANEWNRLSVSVQGTGKRVKVVINDLETLDDIRRHPPGRIGLQLRTSGGVQFRNIRIKGIGTIPKIDNTSADRVPRTQTAKITKEESSPASSSTPTASATEVGIERLRQALLQDTWHYLDSLFPPGDTCRFRQDGTWHRWGWNYWVTGPHEIRVHYDRNNKDKDTGVLFTFDQDLTRFSGSFTSGKGKHIITGTRLVPASGK